MFECSAAVVNLTPKNRRGLEDMLLWRHRVESEKSTMCNYGRFHKNCFKSSNRKGGRVVEELRAYEGQV